jgi:hypothetical protein
LQNVIEVGRVLIVVLDFVKVLFRGHVPFRANDLVSGMGYAVFSFALQ